MDGDGVLYRNEACVAKGCFDLNKGRHHNFTVLFQIFSFLFESVGHRSLSAEKPVSNMACQ